MTAVSGRQHRRVVSVGAVGGVLARRGGRWVVDNDPEVQLLEALRGESGARDRLWALAATLDAGAVDAGQLKRLNGRLSAIVAVERPEDLWRVRVPGNLLGAVAYVCVCANNELLSRWLGFIAGGASGREPGPGAVAGPRLGVVECAAPATLCGVGPRPVLDRRAAGVVLVAAGGAQRCTTSGCGRGV